VPFWLPRALLTLLAGVVLLEVLVIAPQPTALAVVAAVVWMAAPGVLFARRVLGKGDVSGIAAWLVGPALGFAASVLGVFLVWASGVQNWIAIVIGPLLTILLAIVVERSGGAALRLPVFDRRDIGAVAIALLVVPLITWVPYAHVREPLPEGDAYRAYFTADFVWAMTVTSELAKGDVPPANPFLTGETLQYYWLAHFLSGSLYRNVRGWGITAEQVILIDGLAFGLAFVAFFYALARIAGASPPFAALFVLLGFVANSYEGLNRIWILYQADRPFGLMKDYNIDAVTRWFYQGMPVDGLQRLLLYQPHHLTGYVMGLAALWLVALAEDVVDTYVALWAGILLALTFLFSTFTAVILGAAVGVLFAIRLVQQRALGAAWKCAVLGAGPAIVGAVLTNILGYTDSRAGSMIELGLNRVAAREWAWMLFLSFGPLLFAGIAGLLRWRWVVRDGMAAAVIVAIALAFYFFVDVQDMGGVWVGWRSGHQLLVAFSIIGAAAATWTWQRRRWRVPLVVTLLLLFIPAAPTVAIDVFNAQDITNRHQGAGFPWTLIITPHERAALEWLKRSTAPDARVQFEPDARGNGHWAFITAFGERRMVAGLPIAMIPLSKYEHATKNVHQGVFQAATPEQAHAMAVYLRIDYLLISATERRHYAGVVAAMDARPDLFEPVFKNESVTIYRVPAAAKR
jgi:hypothetical protein